MRRPHEWTTPEPVTRREQVLAHQVCDPPSGSHDRDGTGKSTCNAQCAVNWPPLIADTDATASGSFSFITRDDGRKQWAYKGKPLYTWAKDKAPGDATGDGINNVWHLAAP